MCFGVIPKLNKHVSTIQFKAVFRCLSGIRHVQMWEFDKHIHVYCKVCMYKGFIDRVSMCFGVFLWYFFYRLCEFYASKTFLYDASRKPCVYYRECTPLFYINMTYTVGRVYIMLNECFGMFLNNPLREFYSLRDWSMMTPESSVCSDKNNHGHLQRWYNVCFHTCSWIC